MSFHRESYLQALESIHGRESGLSTQEAADRLKAHGPNLLPPAKWRGPLLRFLLQFHNPLIYVLLTAAGVTFWLQDYVDAGVILGVVVINAVIGFIQEGKAERALEAVRAMLASHAMVLRDGDRHEIDAADLVPGDIVLLESGTRVPADLRLLKVKNLRIGEAALTGESVPVEKTIEPVAAATSIGDRTCMAYSGTVVGYGQCRGVVVATGAATEIGRIGTGIMARKRAIIRRLPAVETLGSVSVICSDKTGTLTRNEMTAVRLLLAGRTLEVSGAGYVPEGGFHLDGQPIDPRQDVDLMRLARCALLCNDARLQHDEAAGWTLVGDPTEGALLSLALKAGFDAATQIANAPRIDEIPFESEHRFMATLHHDHAGQVFALLKGAPEQVLSLCLHDSHGSSLDHAAWLARMEQAAAAGQRVLALAECEMSPDATTLAMTDITPRFTLLGLVGMIDPPRPEAIKAVADCQRAGIRVVMITGDHAVTAAAIGRELGINASSPLTGALIETLDDQALSQRIGETDVVARASPEHKLRLVAALQEQGRLEAMTGDGVNDAPALKAADIGVAMGQRGTDAAKEAADLVLTDDNFASIADAVREGRAVFDNIKKSCCSSCLPTAARPG